MGEDTPNRSTISFLLGALIAAVCLIAPASASAAPGELIESTNAQQTLSSNASDLLREKLIETESTATASGIMGSGPISTTSASNKSKAAKRCRHKRTRKAKRRCIRNLKWFFYMPKERAKNTARKFVTYVRRNSTPSEFDDSIPSSSRWRNSRVSDCERKSYSKVSCFSAVWTTYNLLDDYGYVFDEDTYMCGWFHEVWYPYAKRAKLKDKIGESLCIWESEL